MKSVFLFFMLIGLSVANDNLKCETTHSLICSEPVKRALERDWPETEEQLELFCKDFYDEESGCLKEEREVCKDETGLEVSVSVKRGTALSKRMCGKKGDLRQKYLNSIRCIKKHYDTVLNVKEHLVCGNESKRKRILDTYKETCGKDAKDYMSEVFKFLGQYCDKDRVPSYIRRSILI